MATHYSRQLTASSRSLATATRTLKIAEKALKNEIDDASSRITLATITRHLRLAQLINVIGGVAALESEISSYLKNSCKDFNFLDNYSEGTMKGSMLSIFKDTESIFHVSENLPATTSDAYHTEDHIAVITSSSEGILQQLCTICKMLNEGDNKINAPPTQIAIFEKAIKHLKESLPLKYVVSFRTIADRTER